jgi:hypothetical protein
VSGQERPVKPLPGKPVAWTSCQEAPPSVDASSRVVAVRIGAVAALARQSELSAHESEIGCPSPEGAAASAPGGSPVSAVEDRAVEDRAQAHVLLRGLRDPSGDACTRREALQAYGETAAKPSLSNFRET